MNLDTFSINDQRFSQIHAQNCIFAPSIGASGAIYDLYPKVLMQKGFEQSFIERMPVLLVKQ